MDARMLVQGLALMHCALYNRRAGPYSALGIALGLAGMFGWNSEADASCKSVSQDKAMDAYKAAIGT